MNQAISQDKSLQQKQTFPKKKTMSEVRYAKCDVCGVEYSSTDPDHLPRCGTETCFGMILLPPPAPGKRYVRHLCSNNTNCFYAAKKDEKTIFCDRCKLSYVVTDNFGECRSGQTVYRALLSIPWETQLKNVKEEKETIEKENENLKKELEAEREERQNETESAKKEIAEKAKLIKELQQKVEELKEENKCLRTVNGKLTDSVLNLSSAVKKTTKKSKTANHSSENVVAPSELIKSNVESAKDEPSKVFAALLLKDAQIKLDMMKKNGQSGIFNTEANHQHPNDQKKTRTTEETARQFRPAMYIVPEWVLEDNCKEMVNNPIDGSHAQMSLLNQMTDMMQKTTSSKTNAPAPQTPKETTADGKATKSNNKAETRPLKQNQGSRGVLNRDLYEEMETLLFNDVPQPLLRNARIRFDDQKKNVDEKVKPSVAVNTTTLDYLFKELCQRKKDGEN